MAEGDMVMVRGRFAGHGPPVPWIAVDFARMQDGVPRRALTHPTAPRESCRIAGRLLRAHGYRRRHMCRRTQAYPAAATRRKQFSPRMAATNIEQICLPSRRQADHGPALPVRRCGSRPSSARAARHGGPALSADTNSPAGRQRNQGSRRGPRDRQPRRPARDPGVRAIRQRPPVSGSVFGPEW
jgi:hypothetical protein